MAFIRPTPESTERVERSSRGLSSDQKRDAWVREHYVEREDFEGRDANRLLPDDQVPAGVPSHLR